MTTESDLPKADPPIIQEDELKKAIPEIFKRAQVSSEFRQLCLENPGKAVFEVTGKALPDGATLSFSDDQ
ncbi:MAG: hypothetical protein VW771_04845 [Gammaproteobacteria bacterium]|tara:strand:- start:8264 stop:8473 length:210 start_codon:yes stop_codon:yes gene_type:complete